MPLTTYIIRGGVQYVNDVLADGANLWVCGQKNDQQSFVSKIRASDGVELSTAVVGTAPLNIIIVGTEVWAANFNSNNITILDRATGTVITTISADGYNPEGMYNDGANVWMAHCGDGATHIENTVSKISIATRAAVAKYTAGSGPDGVVSDGINFFISNWSDGTITKMAADGTGKSTLVLNAGNSGPNKIIFDNATGCLFVGNSNDSKLYKINPVSFTIAGSAYLGDNYPSPRGLVSAHGYIFVANSRDVYGNTVSKVRASDMVIVDTIAVGVSPRGITYDSINNKIWVANSGESTISGFDAGFDAVSTSTPIQGGVFNGPNGISVIPHIG